MRAEARGKGLHMGRIALAVAVFLMVSMAGLAQTPAFAGNQPAAPQTGTQEAQRMHLAISSVDYPVTPSDVYHLGYRQSTVEIVNLDIQVASDLRVDLGPFGQIDAKGLTFIELKRKVETLVAGIYLRSYPTLSIQSVGSFSVDVGGDFLGVARVNAWGLSRMSEVIAESGIKGASLRKVELQSSAGGSTTFDILLARNSSEPIEDPFVKPRDRIILTAAGRSVRLEGEALRPGDYEILPGEGLKELVQTFGGGPSILADLSRVRIDRMTSSGLVAEYVSLTGGFNAIHSLGDCLTVTLPSRKDAISYVWFEGAIISLPTDPQSSQRNARASTGNPSTTTPTAPATRFSVPIVQGQRLSDILAAVRDRFSPMADLSGASLIRENREPAALNLLAVMAASAPESDITLMPNDLVLIPTIVTTVAVAGAVVSPGSYPFERGMRAAYYVDLAGGSDPVRTIDGAFTITSFGGEQRGSDETVRPGDRIFLPRNAGEVTVSGAVYFPGVFPTRADAVAKYFLNRAGGIDPDRNFDGSFEIRDQGGRSVSPEAVLKGGENIYVPVNNAVITVSGGVYFPGIFPYRADATILSCINRAGGIDPERNAKGTYVVTDRHGASKAPNAPLKSGDRIHVPIDSFSYNFLRYVPVISNLVTLFIVLVPFVLTYLPK